MTSPSKATLDPTRNAALDLIRAHESFLLIGHVRPDGDCVGSQGALARVLTSLGKKVVILNPDHPGDVFDYLYAELPYRVDDGGPLPEHEVVVLLDINELSRTGALASKVEAYGSKKLVIDHHPAHGEPWWDACYMDVTASATGVLVWRIAEQLGVKPDSVLAHAVFTSLVTDTGWFRYSNTDAETMAIASRLVDLGVRPAEVFRSLHQRNAADQPKAIAETLGRVEYFGDGRLAVVDHPLTPASGIKLEESDTVLDILRAVKDVEVVLYLREVDKGICKLSARSKSSYDVNRLARQFGGGGHVKASGATIRGKLAETRERLVQAALGEFTAQA